MFRMAKNRPDTNAPVALLLTLLLVAAIFGLSGCAAVVSSKSTPQTSPVPTPLSITVSSLPAATANVTYSAALSATGATPPYKWAMTAGTMPTGLSMSTGGQISGMPTQTGSFSFTAQVTDSSSVPQSASSNLSMLVNPAAAAPLSITTTSLPAGQVNGTYSATLSFTGGTPGYTWSLASGQLPPSLALNASSGTITGPLTQAGTYTFAVKLTDSGNPVQTAVANLSITVAAAVQVTTTTLPAGDTGSAYSATLAATGGTAPYTWSLSAGSMPGLKVSAAGQITGTPTATGTDSFTVKVTDSSSSAQTATANLSILVVAAGTPVSVTTTSLSGGMVNVAYSAPLAAAGGKGPYTWSLSSGSMPGLTVGASGQITGTPTTAGTASFTVKVTDSSSPAQTATKALTIAVAAAVTPVSVTTSSLPGGTVGTAYSAALAATGGNAPYSWTLAAGSLPGLNVGGTGQITGTPTTAETVSFTVRVTDSSSPALTATANLSIAIVAAVPPVSISTASLPGGTANAAYSSSVAATGGKAPYTWSLAGGSMPGLNISAAGQITGTPTAAGTDSFTVRVSDSSSPTLTATKALTITVVAGVTPVSITTASLPGGTVNTAYSSGLGATGGKAPYTWSLAAGSMPGLTVGASGQITGTPTAAGTDSFTVRVTDSSSPALTATKALTITVAAATVPPVSITTSSLAGGTVGTAYSATLAATGGKAPYTWSLAAGSMPGLSISAVGQITGTPTAAGTDSFTVRVSDSSSPALTATKALTITVAAATVPPVSVTTTSLAGGTVGTAYSATLAATGGKAPYTWSLSAGSMPGLSVGAAGQITGTPTAAGTDSFTVRVSDSSSPALTATKALTITVASSATPVKINTTSLPGGVVSSSYSTALSASGGTSPYTWSILSGSLPPGIALTTGGQVSGTPTQTGTSSLTIQVRDSSATPQTASQAYSVTISAAGSGTSLTACGVLSTAGATYSLQNDVSSTDTCFSVQADNITLNLNGHTITYATNPSIAGKARYGISAVACWDTQVSGGIAQGAACGNGGNSLTVAGPGNINQGANAAPYSHGIRFGQSDQANEPTVHDVTFTFASKSSVGIWSDFQGDGANYFNNTYHNNVTTINNRFEVEGSSIGMYDSGSQTHPATIHNETIIGGAQGGIVIENPGAQVYSNNIQQGNPNGSQSGGTCNASNGCEYANDFGIYVWGSNQQIHDNVINAREGRGIQINSASNNVNGSIVHDNTVTVIEHANNAEYDGCEIDGAYGMQINDTNNSLTNSQIYNNTVLAKALDCPAFGFSWSGAMGGNTSHDNSFTCQIQSGAGSGANPCAGIRLDAKQYTPTFTFTSTRDTLVGDTSSVYTWFDGSPTWTCNQCTFGKGANATGGYVTFSWLSNPGNSSDPFFFVDPSFTGGASKDSNDLSGWSNGKTASYFIQWTYTVTVERSSNSSALSGATVSITDGLGNAECNATTNGSGVASCVLTEERWYNNTGGAHQENRNPHAITISAPACTTNQHSLTITAPTSETRTLAGC
jgi:hypothetical protein